MRLITWNVNRRVSVLVDQAAALASREPDVIALQEVTARTWPLWRAALETIGLPHARCSLEDADPAREPIGRHRTGVLIAARTPLGAAQPLTVPWPETTLAAETGGIVIHTAHVPNAANGWVKPDTLAALRAGLEAGSGPRVLCGDLNTPRRENPDGTVISFARDSRGRLRDERGEPWDSAMTPRSRRTYELRLGREAVSRSPGCRMFTLSALDRQTHHSTPPGGPHPPPSMPQLKFAGRGLRPPRRPSP